MLRVPSSDPWSKTYWHYSAGEDRMLECNSVPYCWFCYHYFSNRKKDRQAERQTGAAILRRHTARKAQLCLVELKLAAKFRQSFLALLNALGVLSGCTLP